MMICEGSCSIDQQPKIIRHKLTDGRKDLILICSSWSSGRLICIPLNQSRFLFFSVYIISFWKGRVSVLFFKYKMGCCCSCLKGGDPGGLRSETEMNHQNIAAAGNRMKLSIARPMTAPSIDVDDSGTKVLALAPMSSHVILLFIRMWKTSTQISLWLASTVG